MAQASDEITVAIQGEHGAFSHQAATLMFGEDARILPRPSFDALFAAVASGAADRALVPIENTLVGSIHENYDRLRALPLHVVGETQLRIVHCLIARPGVTLAGIRTVASHPVALAQCRRFFAERPQLEAVEAYDTAGSVKDLRTTDGVVTRAAIASRLAAEIHGAQVLIEGIEDDPENYTRFLVVGREAAPLPGASKTTVVVTLQNVPGALHRALGVFAERGVDLARIESRPLRGRPWQYAFYLDVLGDPLGVAGDALQELEAAAVEFRRLGSYPAMTSIAGASVAATA